jgi:hypothetical protein
MKFPSTPRHIIYMLLTVTACLSIHLCQRKNSHQKPSFVEHKLKGSCLLLCTSIDLCNVAEEVENTAGVTPLVIIPGDELDEVVVKGDTSLGIEDGGVGVSVHVSGDNVILSVAQYAYVMY